MPNRYDRHIESKVGSPLGAFENVNEVAIPPRAFTVDSQGLDLDLEQEALRARAKANQPTPKYRPVPYRNANPVFFDAPTKPDGRPVMYASEWADNYINKHYAVDPLEQRAFENSLNAADRAALIENSTVPKAGTGRSNYAAWANKLGKLGKMGLMSMFSPVGAVEGSVLNKVVGPEAMDGVAGMFGDQGAQQRLRDAYYEANRS